LEEAKYVLIISEQKAFWIHPYFDCLYIANTLYAMKSI
jgi:hypothetical protein